MHAPPELLVVAAPPDGLAARPHPVHATPDRRETTARPVAGGDPREIAGPPAPLHASGTPASRAPRVERLAAGLSATALAADVCASIAAEVFPDRGEDPAFRSLLASCVGENVRAIVGLWGGRLQLDDVAPEHALAFARTAAEARIPLGTLERTYWIGAGRLWDAWVDVVTAAEPAPHELQALIAAPGRLLFAYVDRVLAAVVPCYEATRASMARRVDDLRRAALDDLLADDGPADPRWEATLGYRLGSAHLAVLVEPGGRVPRETLARRIADAAGATGTMLREEDGGAWVLWLGRPDGFDTDASARLREHLAGVAGRVAVGEPASGVDGVRRSREQALLARRVQLVVADPAGGAPPSWYADVRLEALLLRDEPQARRYVAEELGPLAGDDPHDARVRRSLLAWLSCGSQAAAAAALGVHENTVRQHVRRAESVLPTVLAHRRTELLVALRLDAALGADGGT